MTAFEPIISGIPGLDQAVDSIRLGDNVVWQVSRLEEFFFAARAFARQAIADGRNLIYIRFADHEPILEPQEGLKICTFDPDQGFETFTVQIRECIRQEGFDAFYVFDSLSSLQSAWYTDLMMGNFFQVTCPFLFELDTVAFFPLLRGRHSEDAVSRIRSTTQLLLDVYSTKNALYLHPLEVWNRHSPTMFLPWVWTAGSGQFEPVLSGVAMNQYYKLRQTMAAGLEDLHTDSYDRFFELARRQFLSGTFTEETENQIIESMMSRDPHIQQLIRTYMEPADYFFLRQRMIGSGCIGGKACGMLVARQILETELPEYWDHYEAHDSWYIGSDVFYTYIVANNCWKLRIEQRSPDRYYAAAPALKEALLQGQFPENIRAQFRTMLDYYGQNPIIVRSSSLLEDGFGNAFAGKYDSVFCPNQGSLDQRLEALEQAVRTVYASTMSEDALEYRRQRGLDKKDEQMAILVQRVSGTRMGPLYMPGAAGVGYSYSMYKWKPDMRNDGGMLRLVAGLGTKAVDRTTEDYPRLVDLDHPAASLYGDSASRHKFSQRFMDVLDLEHNELKEMRFETVLPYLDDVHRRLLLERDWEAERLLRERGRPRQVWYISCQKLLEDPVFARMMQHILQTLQKVYSVPVDIEYTINLDGQGQFVMDLLQCRPLYTGPEGSRVQIPECTSIRPFFEIRQASMGVSVHRVLDYVIQVNPFGYYNFEYARKYEAARAIGQINRYFGGEKKEHQILLSVPGRIGTSSPELGVPVTFSDISGFCAVCEVSEERAGYQPELSFGSHMFQDLVEADIFYGAIFKNESTLYYDEDFFQDTEDLFPRICPDAPDLQGIIRVWDVRGHNVHLWADAPDSHAMMGQPVE